MRVAVLITCHNRRDVTLGCLRCLSRCHVRGGLLLDVWLNDDGSTDGTWVAVRAEFPEVRIIQGSGNDFWCGGMRRAWRAAVTSGIDYDGYFWLNDDTWVFGDIFDEMLCFSDRVVVGAILDRNDGKSVIYGGNDLEGNFILPDGTYRDVVRINGNAVWVPRAVYDRIGMFDECWTHAIGDGDYSLRSIKAGFRVVLTRHCVGSCEKRQKMPLWVNKDIPFLVRVRNLYSPLSYNEPFLYFRYNFRHYGFIKATRNFIAQHIRLLIPQLWSREF